MACTGSDERAVPVSAAWDLPALLDSHRHYGPIARPGTDAVAPPLPNPDEVLAALAARVSCICAVSPRIDWSHVAALAAADAAHAAAVGGPEAKPRVVPGFGVHPWFADHTIPRDAEEPAAGEPWDAALRRLLAAHPTAMVAEIGLDKACAADFAVQLRVFQQQLDIAAELGRAVSVHCVRAFGPMLDEFTRRPVEKLPPAVVLHGYSGSADFAKSLLKLSKKRGARFFFGVAAATTGRLAHCDPLLRALPADRIVLESDAHTGDDQALCLAAAVEMLTAACPDATMERVNRAAATAMGCAL